MVDLCGTYNTDNFDENTIMCVNSCTKVVSAIVVAMLGKLIHKIKYNKLRNFILYMYF